MYLIVTVGLFALKREDPTKNEEGVWDTYKVMLAILRKPNILSLIFVHLIAKIGFQANDGATALKLIDKGFGQDNLALAVLIDFPFEIALGYYVGKWSSVYPPLQLWSLAFVGRLGAAGIAQIVVSVFPSGGVVTTWYLILFIFTHVYSTFTNTIMFVAVSAFHAKVADPVYGGTYMTLLATYV
jgi:MFS transporter, PAT family, solute carrier family 33 (acetyl-CoA transportor), member 1